MILSEEQNELSRPKLRLPKLPSTKIVSADLLDKIRQLEPDHPIYEGLNPDKWVKKHRAQYLHSKSTLLQMRVPVENVSDGGGIYVLYLGERMLYVGKSNNFIHRMRQHERARIKQFDMVVTVDCPELCRLALEQAYYDKHKPPLNARRPY